MIEDCYRHYDDTTDTPKTGWGALGLELAAQAGKTLLVDPAGDIWAENGQGEMDWIGELAGGEEMEKARRAAKGKQNERHISGDQ